jgi:hypothetical protein
MIIVLTEERSMEETVRSLMTKYRPELAEGGREALQSKNRMSGTGELVPRRQRGCTVRLNPHCRFSNDTAAYRNPDRVGNASEELSRLTRDRTKVGRARLIAPHLNPARNRSRSFQVFFQALNPEDSVGSSG